MDTGLELNFNLEVEVETKSQGITLAATSGLLLAPGLVQCLAAESAECVGDASESVLCSAFEAAHGELVKGAAAAGLLLVLALPAGCAAGGLDLLGAAAAAILLAFDGTLLFHGW